MSEPLDTHRSCINYVFFPYISICDSLICKLETARKVTIITNIEIGELWQLDGKQISMDVGHLPRLLPFTKSAGSPPLWLRVVIYLKMWLKASMVDMAVDLRTEMVKEWLVRDMPGEGWRVQQEDAGFHHVARCDVHLKAYGCLFMEFSI